MNRILAIVLLAILIGTVASALADAPAYYGALPQLEFKKKDFVGGQMLAVHTGPGEEYPRAGGWAKASTDETIWMAGIQGDWALIMYKKSGSGFRVGWIDKSKLQYRLRGNQLELASRSGRVSRACTLTDDPKNRSFSLAELSAGDSVTVFAQYYDHINWAYVEVWKDNPLCGFIPLDCLE